MTKLRISSAFGPIAEISEDGGIVLVWWPSSDRDELLNGLIDEAQRDSPRLGRSAGDLLSDWTRQYNHWLVEEMP